MTRKMLVTNMFLRKVKSDVELIKKEARMVILIGPKNEINVFENMEGKINVIGIIGPGKANGYYFQEALLEEIGISRSHPYRKGKVPEALQEEDKPKAITYRYSGFSLSQSQYLLVAPIIFDVIQGMADERVAGWQSGTPDNKFYVPGVKCRYNKTSERLEYRSTKKGFVGVDSGVRFSASLEGFFARDIFWAGLIAVGKFARLISLRLEHRLGRKRKTKPKKEHQAKKRAIRPRARASLESLLRFREAQTMIAQSAFSEWLRPNVILCLPDGDNNRFAPHLRNALKSHEETTLEYELAQQALPGQEARINIKLKLISLKKGRKGYVVFEVFPSEDWQKYKIFHKQLEIPEQNNSEPFSDLPF